MISVDFRRSPQADWGLFFSVFNLILEKDKGLQEFKAEIAEEEKLRRFKTVLNSLLAEKVKSMLVKVETSMLAKRVKSLLAKEEEARRTKAWLAEEERKSSERLRQRPGNAELGTSSTAVQSVDTKPGSPPVGLQPVYDCAEHARDGLVHLDQTAATAPLHTAPHDGNCTTAATAATAADAGATTNDGNYSDGRP